MAQQKIIRLAFLILALLHIGATPAMAEDMEEGSGLPVPRFVSLKSAEVNVRTGPGVRYPISWIYKRKSLPVEIVEEFDQWRKLRDSEGSTGWVHKSMVDGRRTVLTQGKVRTLYREPETSAPVARIEPKVIARLLECEPKWCHIQAQNVKGWLPKDNLWGVYPAEQFEKGFKLKLP